MKTRSTRILAMAPAVLLVLAACGGADTSTEAVASATDAPTTTAAPTTTTPPTTTAAPTTTKPPTTTVAPTTTAPPSATPPKDYAGFRAQPTACGAEAPPQAQSAQYGAPDDVGLDPEMKVRATIVTSCGDIVIEMDPAQAPETVNSFVFLAQQGYFAGTVSHRILPGFVVQAGDPTATGRGGPGYIVPDEPPPDGFAYTTGVLAMANAGPNSTGSQFFIMLGDSRLPPLYNAYGVVIDGFDTLARLQTIPLGTSPRGETSIPLETLYIETVVIDPVG